MLSNIEENEIHAADMVFYRIGQVALLPFLLFGLWFAHSGYALLDGRMLCGFRAVTGLPCPGCGGTRAFYYLFRGEFLKSLAYHPVVIAGAAAYVHYMAAIALRRRRLAVRDYSRRLLVQYDLYWVAAVLMIQWAVKLWRIFV